MSMAEREQEADIADRRQLVRAEAFSARLGAIVAPLLILSFSVVAAVLFFGGQHASALVALATALTTYVVPQLVEMRRSSSPQPKARKGDPGPPARRAS